VVYRREHEADADLLDAARHLRRLQVDARAQRLQHVGAARLRRHAAVAVLGHAAAGRGHHEHAGGADVEAVRAVAAGADDVDEVRILRHLDLGRELAHHHRSTGDLADGFLLDAQAGEDGRSHHRRDLAAHDLPHQVDHLVVEDLAMLDGALERGLRGDAQRACCLHGHAFRLQLRRRARRAGRGSSPAGRGRAG